MDRRLLPMDPFSWESGWEPGPDAAEIRARVAAVRQHVLSEFFEATTAMVILPLWSDPHIADGRGFMEGWLEKIYPRRTEAEKIYFIIQGLRREIWIWKNWGVKILAKEHCFAEMLKTVLDRADKFLCAGKTILDGYGQITEGKNTVRMDSHKNEDSLDALSEKTLLNGSADSMNGSYPLYMANYCGVRAAGCITGGLCLQNHITDPYESGCISEKPKPQSANTGSAGKDVHGLTGADTENHCVFLASTDPIDKMEFPRFHWEGIVRMSQAYSVTIWEVPVVHVDLHLIQIVAIEDVTLYKDQTSSVEREASSFVRFSVETSPRKFGLYKIHLPKYCSVHRPIIQLPPSAPIIECVTVPHSVVDPYETGHTSEKTKPQSANTAPAFKDVRGLTDAEPENHGMFLASTDPIDKMEDQPWRDSTLMIWVARRQILFLACLYVSVTYTLDTWTTGILEDRTEPFKYEDQTSFIGSEVRTINFFYIPGVIRVYLILAPKFQSVHQRPLVQMVPFACTLYDGRLPCVKSIVPKSIVDLYELGPLSTNPNVDKLNHAEPENHGAPDSVDCRITEAEDKTAATWLIDTGAVHHATGNLSLLAGVTTVNNDDLFITARDGVRMLVHAQGSVITDTVVLPDVWYIPTLTKNVVSASQLNKLGYSIGFTRGTCFIKSAADATLIGKGHVSDDGLFEMDFLKVS